ncbi:Hypothetical protein FKW44_005393 [Caligus rogercresseyi]|uniref:Uncharacterized protein n=1 Tax=Caligus rogercresseyi TaxID=217165 RepID=A0A7T8KBW0_CALRO|nr:Hypothetical protein FKW44_005393 [Caligus rogercresseyi]
MQLPSCVQSPLFHRIPGQGELPTSSHLSAGLDYSYCELLNDLLVTAGLPTRLVF